MMSNIWILVTHRGREQACHALRSATAHVAEQFARQLGSMPDDGRNRSSTGNSCWLPNRAFRETCTMGILPLHCRARHGGRGQGLGGVDPHHTPKYLGDDMRL